MEGVSVRWKAGYELVESRKWIAEHRKDEGEIMNDLHDSMFWCFGVLILIESFWGLWIGFEVVMYVRS